MLRLPVPWIYSEQLLYRTCYTLPFFRTKTSGVGVSLFYESLESSVQLSDRLDIQVLKELENRGCGRTPLLFWSVGEVSVYAYFNHLHGNLSE